MVWNLPNYSGPSERVTSSTPERSDTDPERSERAEGIRKRRAKNEMSRPTFDYREFHSRLDASTQRRREKMRQANSPWGKDHKVIIANRFTETKDFRLEVDGKEVDLDTYQAEQKRKAFAMRGKR